jgi:hypothetical protein
MFFFSWGTNPYWQSLNYICNNLIRSGPPNCPFFKPLKISCEIIYCIYALKTYHYNFLKKLEARLGSVQVEHQLQVWIGVVFFFFPYFSYFFKTETININFRIVKKFINNSKIKFIFSPQKTFNLSFYLLNCTVLFKECLLTVKIF